MDYEPDTWRIFKTYQSNEKPISIKQYYWVHLLDNVLTVRIREARALCVFFIAQELIDHTLRRVNYSDFNKINWWT